MASAQPTPAESASSQPSASSTDGKKKMSMADFDMIRYLGEGSFSEVRQVRYKPTGREHAHEAYMTPPTLGLVINIKHTHVRTLTGQHKEKMKIVCKTKVVREKKEKYIASERAILIKLAHPFIIKLFSTFRDQYSLFFVLTLAKRGDLNSHCNRVKCLDMDSARFYIAEMVEALKYLASMSIVHRDLKPENILLGANWHILLADFGTARELQEKDFSEKRKSSFVGTAQFAPPEIIQTKPVSMYSDLWSLGSIVYYMLSGRYLFHAPSAYGIFKFVNENVYTIPDGFPAAGADLIRKLVVSDPDQRLGAADMGGFEALMAHPFFEGIEWDKLEDQTPPPIRCYVPTLDACSQIDVWEHFYTASYDHDEEALTALQFPDGSVPIEFGLNGAANSDGHPAVIVGKSQAELDVEKEAMVKQAETYPIWHPFCKGDLIQKTTPAVKHSGYWPLDIQMVLTDKRLFVVNLEDFKPKKDITMDKHTIVERVRDDVILIHTGTNSSCFQFSSDEETAEWQERLEKACQRKE